MRLINADTHESYMRATKCQHCDNWNGVKCRACWVEDAILSVGIQATVEAIPIDWIKQQIDKGKWAELVQRWNERRNTP